MVSKKFPEFIRIAALDSAPKEPVNGVTDVDGKTIYTVDAQYISVLADALHVSYQLIDPEEVHIGKNLGNGSWSGVFGLLQRGECDISINKMGINEERTQVIDFSNPYYITDTTFLTHNPEPMPKSLAILYPFEYSVWVAFAPLFLTVSILIYFLYRKTKSFQYVLLRVYASLLEQPLQLNFSSSPKRFFLFTWITSIMFLSYSYKGILLAFLSFPPMRGVRNIPELAKAITEGSHVGRTFEGSYLIPALLESPDESLRIIGKSLKAHQVTHLDFMGLMKNTTPPINAIVTGRLFLSAFQGKYFLSEDSLFTMMFGVAVRKTFCCKGQLDRAIRKIFEAGLYDKHLRYSDLMTSLNYLSYNPDTEETRALGFEDITGALGLLLLGLSLSSLVLLWEILSHKLSRKPFK